MADLGLWQILMAEGDIKMKKPPVWVASLFRITLLTFTFCFLDRYPRACCCIYSKQG